MVKTFTFYSDEGHGWLKVTRAMIDSLGVAELISPYSYQKDDFVYLEEDCDAEVFLVAYKRKYGLSPHFRDIHSGRNRRIRNYEKYSM